MRATRPSSVLIARCERSIGMEMLMKRKERKHKKPRVHDEVSDGSEFDECTSD